MRLAASRTFCTAGTKRPIKMAMMAITTNSSIRVKARRRRENRGMTDPPLGAGRGGAVGFHASNLPLRRSGVNDTSPVASLGVLGPLEHQHAHQFAGLRGETGGPITLWDRPEANRQVVPFQAINPAEGLALFLGRSLRRRDVDVLGVLRGVEGVV